MKRYIGEGLPAGCRIAVIANDALGNYVVTTPLLQMLHAQHRPACVHYYSGVRTAELWSRDPNVDWGFPLCGSQPEVALKEARGPYDLIVNIENSSWAKSFCSVLAGPETWVCGPCLSADSPGDEPFPNDFIGHLSNDPDWTASDLPFRHPLLQSGFMGEILCRTAYLGGEVPGYSVPMEMPERDIPDVLIATAASLPEKLWETDKWLEILRNIAKMRFTVGLIGAAPADQRRYWYGNETEELILEDGMVQDLRGKFRLPEVVGALSRARLCLTLDNGILHLAAAVNAPTVGLFRHGYHRLWAPPNPNLMSLIPNEHERVSSITVHDVLAGVEANLRLPLPRQYHSML